MTHGIVYVKKASQWQFYVHRNVQNQQDVIEWFSTEEEALKRLKEYESNTEEKI